MFELILKPYIITTVFFHSLFKKQESNRIINNQILRIVLHFIYSLFISLYSGFIMALFGVVFTITFLRLNIDFDIYIVLGVSIFNFICFAAVVLKNIYNRELNLPEMLFNSYFIFLTLKSTKSFMKTLLFILCVSISLFLALAFIIAIILPKISVVNDIVDDYMFGILMLDALFSLAISIFIYNGSNQNSIINHVRQFTLWSLISLSLAIFTSYRVYLILILDESVIGAVDIVVLFISSILGLKIIPDIWTNLYKEFYSVYSETLDEIWDSLENLYSFGALQKKVKKQGSEIAVGIKNTKQEWRKGQRGQVIFSFTLMISLAVFGLILVFSTNHIQTLFNNLVNHITYLWVSLFNGDKKMSSLVFFLLCLIAWFLWTIKKLISEFKDSDLNRKIILIGRLLIISIFLITTISIFFLQTISIVVTYIILILIGLISILSFFIKKQ